MYVCECIGAATNIAQQARDLFVYPPKRVYNTCKNVYTIRTKVFVYAQRRECPKTCNTLCIQYDYVCIQCDYRRCATK